MQLPSIFYKHMDIRELEGVVHAESLSDVRGFKTRHWPLYDYEYAVLNMLAEENGFAFSAMNVTVYMADDDNYAKDQLVEVAFMHEHNAASGRLSCSPSLWLAARTRDFSDDMRMQLQCASFAYAQSLDEYLKLCRDGFFSYSSYFSTMGMHTKLTALKKVKNIDKVQVLFDLNSCVKCA